MAKRKGVEEVKEGLLAPRERRQVVPNSDLLKSGSTLLDLACSDRTAGAFPKGSYNLLAGTSDAGKTWVGLSALAEAANDHDFDGFRLIYDAPEDGARMDRAFFFGSKMQERVEPPAGTPDEPKCSNTVEEFYDHLDDAFDRGEPFVYLLDSESALVSAAEVTKQGKQRKARERGTKEAGDYGTAKPKYHRQRLGKVCSRLKQSGSILIMISHLTENIGFGSMFEKHHRPGGTALKFYATVEIWIYNVKTFYKEFGRPTKDEGKKKKRIQTGVLTLAKVKRTRLTGKKRNVEIPIYHSTGIDDVGANVDYLVEWGHWQKNKGMIKAIELNVVANREDLIHEVEGHAREGELRKAVRRCWQNVEKAAAVQRKPRYS